MNKRIIEIAQEVFSFKYKTAPNELNPGHHMDHIHLFAELIVKECAGIVESAVDHREPASSYVGRIKEHFGIEE
jgi:hypothetical protein